MTMDVLQLILRFFVAYGYVFLFLATTLENIPVVGIFLPGEVIVVAAGFFAASGEFELPIVIAIACFGALLGTIASYAIGFWGGRRMIEIIAVKMRADGNRIKDADAYFSTHGPMTVFVGRYMTGVKAFIPALAGAHRMAFGRFLFFASLGIVSWTVIAGVLGFFFGAHWETLIGIVKTAGWLLLLLVVILIAIIWYRRRQRETRSSKDT